MKLIENTEEAEASCVLVSLFHFAGPAVPAADEERAPVHTGGVQSHPEVQHLR